MSEPVDLRVRVGSCPCPGTPHADEHVFLEPELTLPMASAAMAGLGGTTTTGDVEAALTAAFLPRGIRAWTFLELDDKGALQPVEVTRDNMERLLPFDNGGYELIEKVGAMGWTSRFMRPLVARMPTSSPPGPTSDSPGSTSANPISGQPLPEPSRPSSLNGGAGKRSAAPVR